MNERKDIAENVTIIQKQRVIKDYAVGIYARVSTSHKAQMDSLFNTFLFIFTEKKLITYPMQNNCILMICFPPIKVANKIITATTINHKPQALL